jgi:hypothetical protein
MSKKYSGNARVFSSGDSNSECEMLATVRDGIVDINNHLNDSLSCTYGFYQKACRCFKSLELSTKNNHERTQRGQWGGERPEYLCFLDLVCIF